MEEAVSGRTPHNYQQMGQDYITGEMSIRALAADNGITPSTLARQARLRGWYEERAKYRQSLQTRTMELVADSAAAGLAKRNEKFLSISEEMLDAFRVHTLPLYKEGKVPLTVKDLALVVDTMLKITGAAPSKSVKEERRLEGIFTADLSSRPDLLGLLEDLTRDGNAGTAEGTAGPVVEAASPD